MHTILSHSVYEYGHAFPLGLALVALIFILGNRARFKANQYYAYYLACSAAFLVASIAYIISVILGIHLLHGVAGAAETVCVAAIVWMARSDYIKDGRSGV